MLVEYYHPKLFNENVFISFVIQVATFSLKFFVKSQTAIEYLSQIQSSVLSFRFYFRTLPLSSTQSVYQVIITNQLIII